MAYDRLVKKIYKILAIRATKYDPIYYGDLYRQLGLDHTNPNDRRKASVLLEAANEISGKEYMITAFAVSKNGNGPYEGFYSLAERYGRIRPDLTDDQKDKFWIKEMKSVHEKYKCGSLLS
jgi:hypothetical protein